MPERTAIVVTCNTVDALVHIMWICSGIRRVPERAEVVVALISMVTQLVRKQRVDDAPLHCTMPHHNRMRKGARLVDAPKPKLAQCAMSAVALDIHTPPAKTARELLGIERHCWY